jgi:DNA-binding NarL/FixJ family response regulator
MRTRILLADPQQLFRQCLRALLEQEADLAVVGDVDDGRALVDLSSIVTPDVVCLDAEMPYVNGIQATRRIKQSSPDIRVIAVSTRIDVPTVRAMVAAGADAYVSKSASVDDFLRAVRGGMSTRRRYFCTEVTASVLDAVLENKSVLAANKLPAGRDRQALRLVANNPSPQAIPNFCQSISNDIVPLTQGQTRYK